MLNDATSSWNVIAREMNSVSDMRHLESAIDKSGAASSVGEKCVADLRCDSVDWIHSDLPMDDPGFVEIVIEFVPQLKLKLEEMHQALDTDNFVCLANLAHWLKGSGGTCGFLQLYQPALELEKSAKLECAAASTKWLKELVQLSNRIWIPTSAGPLAN